MPRPLYPSDRTPRTRRAPGHVQLGLSVPERLRDRLTALAEALGLERWRVLERALDALDARRPPKRRTK